MVIVVAPAPLEFGSGDAKRTVAPPLPPLPMRTGRMSNETIMREKKDVEEDVFKISHENQYKYFSHVTQLSRWILWGKRIMTAASVIFPCHADYTPSI